MCSLFTFLFLQHYFVLKYKIPPGTISSAKHRPWYFLCLPFTCSLVKDIHDFDGIHCDWLKHAAVTLIVHHHHEEVTAGDLLDHEGPVNPCSKKQTKSCDKKVWGTSKSWLASRHGDDVSFHVWQRICVRNVHIARRGEKTGRVSREWLVSPPAVNKYAETDGHQL